MDRPILTQVIAAAVGLIVLGAATEEPNRAHHVTAAPECWNVFLARPEPGAMTRGCIWVVGDTLNFSYRANDGTVLARGYRFYVPPERLDYVGDSVLHALQEQYGPGNRCPIDTMVGPYVRLDHQWHRWGRTIQVQANSIQGRRKTLTPFVAVEEVEDDLPCLEWIDEPRRG